MFEKIYEELRMKAIFKYEEYDEYMRYYLGREDYEKEPIASYLLDLLNEYIENDEVMKEIAPLFEKEFPGYIEEIIKENSKILYVLEHKEEYLKLGKLLENVFDSNLQLEELESLEYEGKKEEEKICAFLKVSNEEYQKFKDKKYNIIKIFNGERKEDIIKLNQISKKINNEKNILNQTKSNNNLLNKECNDMKLKIKDMQEEIQTISSKLKSDFKNDIEKMISDSYYLGKNYDLEETLNNFNINKKACIEENKRLYKIKELTRQKENSIKVNSEIVEEDDEEEWLEN